MAAVSMTFETTASGNGISVFGSTTATVVGESSVYARPSVPAAKTATLTTRTNDTSGVLTLATGHGLTTGQVVDLYWEDGQCHTVTLGTTTSTTAPIASVAGGDALPVADTTIYVGVRVAVSARFLGADLVGLALTAGITAGTFTVSDGTYNRLTEYITAGDMYSWYEDSGITNPLDTYTLTTLYISHGDPNRAVDDLTFAALLVN